MTSATTEPARGAGGRPSEGHGYGLVLFASVLVVVVGCFNLIYGIAAIAAGVGVRGEIASPRMRLVRSQTPSSASSRPDRIAVRNS